MHSPQVRQNPLVEQSGVISRGQAQANGLSEADVRRLLRRREWVVVHPGVYVNHTGELTWLQRAWAAVLFAWPAALSHDSALRAADGPGKHTEEVIHVAVGRDRRIAAPPRVCIHRMAHLHDRTQWNLGPPRVRYEDAALDVGIAVIDRSRSPGCGRIRGPVPAYDGRADARPTRRPPAHASTSLAGGRPRGRGDRGLLRARARVPEPRRTGSWPSACRTAAPCDRDPGGGLPRCRVRDVDRGARWSPVP